MLTYEFTRWWAYRRIQHPMMPKYIWYAPIGLTVLLLLFYALLPIKPVLGGPEGLLRSISQILALLPGFFISALAAVATFNRNEMDETMPEPAPIVQIAHRGKMLPIELTRRMFLSYLFSYLSILSVILFTLISVAPYIAPNIRSALSFLENYSNVDTIYLIVKYGFLLFICYFISSLLFTMLHGIYFLCERIHMPNT